MNVLFHRNPFIRKGTASALAVVKAARRWTVSHAEFAERPPVLVNSVPKSGTHLLLQAALAIPGSSYWGAFVAHAWSVTLRERPPLSVIRRLSRLLPGEVAAAHVRWCPMVSRYMIERPVLHLFIYRDPRDIVVSERAYLVEMNRWHRLHRVLASLPGKKEQLDALIEGIPGLYDDIGSRVRSFCAWVDDPQVVAVRFEDLQGPTRERTLAALADRVSAGVPSYGPAGRLARQMAAAIDPARSPTFRRGKPGQWRSTLSASQADRVRTLVGTLMNQLGYE